MQVNSNVDMQDEKNSDEVEDENEYEYDRKVNHAYLKNHKNMDFRSVAKKGFKDQ